ncbi:MAG: DMT family transporter [Catalinimonas sp.]
MLTPGVRYMLLSTVAFALMNVCIKLLAHLPSWELVFFRAVISLGLSWVFLKRAGVPVWGKRRGLLVGRGLAGAFALLLYFQTLQEIPLATAVTLQYLSPVFTALLAVPLLGERMKLRQWGYFLLSFLGVFLIKGFDPRVPPLYLLMGVGAALLAGLAYNLVRKLRTTDHPLVVIFYFPLVTIPVVGPYTLLHWVPPSGRTDWLLIGAVGVCTQAGQFYLTKALQAEVFARVMPLNYLGVGYALVMGFVLFGERFHPLSLVGMGFVLLGVLLNLLRK